ncbi:MAG: hypothetical protein K2X93_00045 [Candidatus Obscuribacterales bacterium]|nr:hypothetical protein [Candidatus Obscuribacterales bacterium]
MQKQETAIYVCVSASRAQWYFLNRTEAFRQRFDTGSDVLIGYKRYEDAVKAGRLRFAEESCFVILSISINEHVRNALAIGQMIDDDALEDKTNAPLWRVFSKGAEILANPKNAAIWGQVIEVKPGKKETTGGGAGTAGKSETQATLEPTGITGFGGC